MSGVALGHVYRHTLIIAMTVNAFAADKARCLEAGMDDFLIKPFGPDTLFAILSHSLSRQAIWLRFRFYVSNGSAILKGPNIMHLSYGNSVSGPAVKFSRSCRSKPDRLFSRRRFANGRCTPGCRPM